MTHFIRLLLLALVLVVPDEITPPIALGADDADVIRQAPQKLASMWSDPQVEPADPDGDPLLFDRISLRVAAPSPIANVTPLSSPADWPHEEHPFRPPRA